MNKGGAVRHESRRFLLESMEATMLARKFAVAWEYMNQKDGK